MADKLQTPTSLLNSVLMWQWVSKREVKRLDTPHYFAEEKT